MMTQPDNHIPVLKDQVVSLLSPTAGDIYFDGTAGFGGHAGAIAPLVGDDGHLILVDRDRQATEHLRKLFGQRAEIIRRDYATAAAELREDGRLVDMVLLDLGVSSPQLDNPERGFSFQSEGPLDMRMDQSAPLTAADVINRMPQAELADIIYRYGEERHSRRIARALIQHRPFTTTKQVADLIIGTVGWRKGDIHPATRTFQALRIYVNAELEQLETALPDLVALLKPGGRIAVISFHSLEDRIVKEFFNRESKDCICPPEQPVCTCNHVASLTKLTKKAITGSDDTFNPRARSAKLRAAVKIKTKKGNT
jgi:16S rRNA (cytosine1402-N4)-methyltransferase